MEHEKIDLSFVKDELLYVLISLGEVELPKSRDVDEIETDEITIKKETFAQLILHPRALDIFNKIGVDCDGLVDHATHIYEKKGNEHLAISFQEFVDSLLELRGANTATVRNIVEVRNLLRDELTELKNVFDTSRKRKASLHPILHADAKCSSIEDRRRAISSSGAAAI